MVKRTTTTTSGEYKPPEGAIWTNPSSDPLAAFKKWRENNSPNSYADFIRENPYPNVSESSNVSDRFQGLPRGTMKSTEGGKRRRKTITKSKTKKNKSKKNKSKKNKSKKSKK